MFDSFTYTRIAQGGTSLAIQNQPWVRKISSGRYILNDILLSRSTFLP